MKPLMIDELAGDWIKRGWDLPPYKSAEFMKTLRGSTLEDFRKLPVYKYAEENGLIVDDKWHEEKQ